MEVAESEAVSASGVKSNLGVRPPHNLGGVTVAVEVFIQHLGARQIPLSVDYSSVRVDKRVVWMEACGDLFQATLLFMWHVLQNLPECVCKSFGEVRRDDIQ